MGEGWLNHYYGHSSNSNKNKKGSYTLLHDLSLEICVVNLPGGGLSFWGGEAIDYCLMGCVAAIRHFRFVEPTSTSTWTSTTPTPTPTITTTTTTKDETTTTTTTTSLISRRRPRATHTTNAHGANSNLGALQTPIPVPFTAITTTLLLMPNSDSIGGVESYSIIVDPTVEEIASVEGAFSPWDEGKNTISATSSNFAGSSGYKSRPRSLMTIGHDGFGSVTLLEFVGGPVESGTLLEAVKLGSKVANGRLKWVEGVVKRGNKDAEEKELAEVRKDKAVEKEKEMDDVEE